MSAQMNTISQQTSPSTPSTPQSAVKVPTPPTVSMIKTDSHASAGNANSATAVAKKDEKENKNIDENGNPKYTADEASIERFLAHNKLDDHCKMSLLELLPTPALLEKVFERGDIEDARNPNAICIARIGAGRKALKAQARKARQAAAAAEAEAKKEHEIRMMTAASNGSTASAGSYNGYAYAYGAFPGSYDAQQYAAQVAAQKKLFKKQQQQALLKAHQAAQYAQHYGYAAPAPSAYPRSYAAPGSAAAAAEYHAQAHAAALAQAQAEASYSSADSDENAAMAAQYGRLAEFSMAPGQYGQEYSLTPMVPRGFEGASEQIAWDNYQRTSGSHGSKPSQPRSGYSHGSVEALPMLEELEALPNLPGLEDLESDYFMSQYLSTGAPSTSSAERSYYGVDASMIGTSRKSA